VTDARLAALRALLDDRGLDAVLISRTANKRYFSGFRLTDAEGPTSGWSGTLLVTRDASLILADSRYTEQATHEAPGFTLVQTTGPMDADLPPMLLEHGIESLGMEAAVVPHAAWSALAAAAPGVELHAIDDELAPLRLLKTPDEVDAIARACALGDACFAHMIEWIRPGMTEDEVAWELEGYFRANGAEGLAFDTIVLAGPPLVRDGRARQRPAARLRVHRRRVPVGHDPHPVRRGRAGRHPPLSRRRARGAGCRHRGARRGRQRPRHRRDRARAHRA
jgi:Xaa-Pro aminopeptidase